MTVMFKSISFEVTGDKRLVCKSCEQRVERMLRSLEGVSQVRAQADTQRIDVLFDAAVVEVEFRIPNLVCEGCAEKIDGVLRPMAGVREIRANVPQKRIHVRYEP